MQQPFSSIRLGPILGLVGSIIVLKFFFLPWNSYLSEWNSIAWQGIVDPMVALVLLAALAVFGLSAAALFRPFSPVLGGLGLYAASVGLLAQVYIFLHLFMDTGATLLNIPQLFSILVSLLFTGSWLLLFGFLLSGGAMALTALKAEQRSGAALHRDHLPDSPGTEQPVNEYQPRESTGGRPSSQEEVDEQESVWNIDKRHILAMTVGIMLYSVLSNLYILWEGPGEENVEIVFPGIVLVLYFGIVYGPLVGLVTGGIGSFLNYAISTLAHVPYWLLSNYGMLNSVPLNTSHPRVYWPIVIGDAVVGLIAGFPLFGAAGRDKTARSLLAVMMRGALAIVIGIFLMVICYQVGQPMAMTLLGIQSSFTSETIPTLLVVMLLLPLLLVLSLREPRAGERARQFHL